jgi:hypothetical protein
MKKIPLKFYLRQHLIEVGKMLSDLKLKRLKCQYESYTIDFFFDHEVAGLLESTFGMRTVLDLVDVEPLRLVATLFYLSLLEEIDQRIFYENFLCLYEFFETY